MKYFYLSMIVLFLMIKSNAQQNVANSRGEFLKSSSSREEVEIAKKNKDAPETLIKIKDDRRSSLRSKYLVSKNISIYGAGGILGVATGKNDTIQSSSATGSLGINILTERISTDLFYSFNGQKEIDMNINQLGVALLNNNLSGSAFSISSNIRFHKHFGANMSLTAVNNTWVLDGIKHNASPVILKGGLVFIPFDISNNKDVDFSIKAQYTLRRVLGDISDVDDGVHKVGDNEIDLNKPFHGFEGSFNMFIKSLEMYTQFSYNGTETHIPGFSGWQVSIGLNISADVINLK